MIPKTRTQRRWMDGGMLTAWLLCGVALAPECGAETSDPRNIRTGYVVPDQGYCDQPYIVITRDGNWLCTMTTGRGREGDKGQHVVAAISQDKGETWGALIDIEPETGPEASWVVPLILPTGRVYVFYDYNGDEISGRRADMLGWYVFKYSDDNGQTWSKERYRLPVRRTACDEDNGLEGRTQIFWGIDKPMIYNGDVYFAFTKLGRYMLDLGEGWLFRSTNILTESDPAKIRWEMLPEGEHGIRAERFGSVQEEHNLVGLSNNTLFCMYRTTTGRPCHTYSLDGGRNWLPPEHATYSPGGKKFKHNRACPAVWQAKNGKYLFWFNHHGGRTFNERNPVWLSGGIEKNGRIHWSQPEIALYDPDGIPVRISYPDLIEQDGRVWISQTQKSVARVNEIDPALLEGLWTQGKRNRAATDGLVLDLKEKVIERGGVPAPELPNLTTGDGFSVDFWIRLDGPAPRQTILDTRDDREKGVHLLVIQNSQGASVRIRLNDGTTQYSWDADPGSLAYGTWHHVAIIVDGGPKVLSYVIDGVVNDGGTVREHGWGRIPNSLGNLNAAKTVTLAPTLNGKLKRLRVYNRFLRTSEAIANYHAGH